MRPPPNSLGGPVMPGMNMWVLQHENTPVFHLFNPVLTSFCLYSVFLSFLALPSSYRGPGGRGPWPNPNANSVRSYIRCWLHAALWLQTKTWHASLLNLPYKCTVVAPWYSNGFSTLGTLLYMKVIIFIYHIIIIKWCSLIVIQENLLIFFCLGWQIAYSSSSPGNYVVSIKL